MRHSSVPRFWLLSIVTKVARTLLESCAQWLSPVITSTGRIPYNTDPSSSPSSPPLAADCDQSCTLSCFWHAPWLSMYCVFHYLICYKMIQLPAPLAIANLTSYDTTSTFLLSPSPQARSTSSTVLEAYGELWPRLQHGGEMAVVLGATNQIASWQAFCSIHCGGDPQR